MIDAFHDRSGRTYVRCSKAVSVTPNRRSRSVIVCSSDSQSMYRTGCPALISLAVSYWTIKDLPDSGSP